jgi:pantoate--beta-alanine ligase
VRTIRTVDELRAALADAGNIGLVPTMGAFHEGHLFLLRAARKENDVVVASLFVNPAQFDDESDLDAYPRDEARDAQLAAEAGVDILFAPSLVEMYPAGFQTWVDVEGVSRGLEGEARPGHFRAVATVCLKLFNIVRPARAYFGQKDAQQAAVIRRLVCDLNLPLEIRVLPTVHDTDGLALSSRNARLSPEDRARALALPRALARGAEIYRLGGDAVAATRAALNGLTPDYVELFDLDGALVLATAVRIGSTRLIDNVVLEVPCQASAWLGPTNKGELP